MSSTRWDCRNVAQRWVIHGELVLESPCRLTGGEGTEVSDAPVLRDEEDRPYLPGTTLAGLARHGLDPVSATELLGPDISDSAGEQSRLLFSDARCSKDTGVECRDGVAICPKRGVALDKKKYDLELISAGTTFTVRLELLLPDDEIRAKRLKHLTGIILSAFENGRVRLGGRTTRGFGKCRVTEWKLQQYAFQRVDQLLDWLQGSTRWTRLSSGKEWIDATQPGSNLEFEVIMELRVQGSLLIGAGSDAADKRQLTRNGPGGKPQPVIPGTSLAGILRSHCRKISNTLGLDPKVGEDLFGGEGRASKVRFEEAPIQGGTTLRHSRIKMDPWTGGVREGLLFDMDCQYRGTLQLTLVGRSLTDTQKALLILCIRDVALGHLGVGGQTGVGRGRLLAVEGRPVHIAEPDCRLHFHSGQVQVEPQGALDSIFAALGGA